MRSWSWIVLLLVAVGCSSGGRMMTVDAFYGIPIGTSKEDVLAQAGGPATVEQKEDGTEEIVYIERVTAGARILQERRYIFTMKDGKVLSKRVEQSSPLPTTFDSYDMQTTNNTPP